jgi:hypothetical protein
MFWMWLVSVLALMALLVMFWVVATVARNHSDAPPGRKASARGRAERESSGDVSKAA